MELEKTSGNSTVNSESGLQDDGGRHSPIKIYTTARNNVRQAKTGITIENSDIPELTMIKALGETKRPNFIELKNRCINEARRTKTRTYRLNKHCWNC